jgi:hypothetical protein
MDNNNTGWGRIYASTAAPTRIIRADSTSVQYMSGILFPVDTGGRELPSNRKCPFCGTRQDLVKQGFTCLKCGGDVLNESVK